MLWDAKAFQLRLPHDLQQYDFAAHRVISDKDHLITVEEEQRFATNGRLKEVGLPSENQCLGELPSGRKPTLERHQPNGLLVLTKGFALRY